MSGVLSTMIIVALGAVLVALGLGVLSMLKGGAFSRRYGNRLMRLRVLLQFTALALIALAFFLRDG
ncbi:MAG: twin transmembrane helix small protein [Rhodospirillales bacterium]|nr:twin transmembrane helix small protein [Rhodospirillales bacterium]